MRQALQGLDPSAGLGKLRHHLDALGVSMPVLYRQYVDLVEPDGVQFLDFGEDPGFSGCVDGLVMLDLGTLKPAKRSALPGRQSLIRPGWTRCRAFATEQDNGREAGACVIKMSYNGVKVH